MAGNPHLQTTYRQGTHQKAAFTGTAGTISSGFGSQTKTVRVIVTAAAYVRIGNSPTATTADMYMAADLPEYFTVSSGQKVSAVQVSAAGDLHVTEMDQ
jgi:hypothetical protein